jgi:hypothetical protein
MEAAGPGTGSTDGNNALKIGGALLGLAILVFGFFQLTDGGDEDANTAACTLGTSGITTVVAGFSRGQSAKAIIAAAGPTLGSLACKQFVSALSDDPAQAVDYQLETTEGSVQTQTVSQQELLNPAPNPPTSATTPLIISCLRWQNAYLYRLCVDGAINPPAAAPPYGGYP